YRISKVGCRRDALLSVRQFTLLRQAPLAKCLFPQLRGDRVQAAEESTCTPDAEVGIDSGELMVHAVLGQLEGRCDLRAGLCLRILVNEQIEDPLLNRGQTPARGNWHNLFLFVS